MNKGTDAKLGARPMARVIQTQVKLPLSEKILFGELKSGGVVSTTLKAKGGEKELHFKVTANKKPPKKSENSEDPEKETEKSPAG